MSGVSGIGGGAMSVDRVMALRSQILERNQALSRAGASGRVVALNAAEAAHGVSDERQDGLTGEVVTLGECRHDHRGPHVPDRAAQQHRVVPGDVG